MTWIFVIVGTIAVVEAFLALPFIRKVRELIDLVNRIGKTIRSSSISDHWKEKILPVYAGKMFLLSITLFALLIAALAPMGVAAIIGESMGFPVATTLSGFAGIAGSTVIALVYLMVRKRVISG